MHDDRIVRQWLLASALAVLLAVAVGGITRLTNSGLSITVWEPVAGVLPPLHDADWADAYARYRTIPEAQTVHRGITLDGFKRLYWWEWTHRILARVVGLVLALPYFVLLARGRMRRRYRARLALLPLLAAAQGALGWYMVKSGLEVRTDVSAYRLAAHLALALVIFAIIVWTLLDTDDDGSPTRPRQPSRALVAILTAATALTFVTLVSGAFVAGLDAGRIFNTFPLMGGQWVPPGYHEAGAWWRNALENPIAAQFHHRVLATTTGIVLLTLALSLRGSRSLRWLGVLVVAQVALGITTLLLAVPVTLGVLHQVTGVLVLESVLTVLHRARAGRVTTRRADAVTTVTPAVAGHP